MYVRIYERKKLDSKIRSKNVYMLVKGEYYSPNAGGGQNEETKEDDIQFGKMIKN